jgi:molybdate transport system regulatory protein
MNKLPGIVSSVKSSGELCLLEVLVEESLFSAVVIENIDTFKNGQEVVVLFKETEVAIGKDFIGKISLRNQFEGFVEEIVEGDILSQVWLNFKGKIISSIITTSSIKDLDLKVGERAIGFVKTNELMLSIN